MVLKLTQSQLVASQAKEVVPVHPHFNEGGAFYRKAPDAMDGRLVRAEMRKMMRGEPDAAYYPAFQPMLYYDPEALEFVSSIDELLLRQKDGGISQNFPAAVTYHLSAAERQEFALWQTRIALERAEKTGRKVQVNWWEDDLMLLKDAVVALVSRKNVVIELTEFKKDVDAPGYPVFTTFTQRAVARQLMSTIGLLAFPRGMSVLTSLDDCNWIKVGHPCSIEFALEAAPFLNQVKLDIKACAQVYNQLPNVAGADKFAPLEPDVTARAVKAQCMVEFVSELRVRNPEIVLVLEFSVCTRVLGEMFPSMNPFTEDWVMVQGGLTDNWASFD